MPKAFQLFTNFKLLHHLHLGGTSDSGPIDSSNPDYLIDETSHQKESVPDTNDSETLILTDITKTTDSTTTTELNTNSLSKRKQFEKNNITSSPLKNSSTKAISQLLVKNSDNNNVFKKQKTIISTKYDSTNKNNNHQISSTIEENKKSPKVIDVLDLTRQLAPRTRPNIADLGEIDDLMSLSQLSNELRSLTEDKEEVTSKHRPLTMTASSSVSRHQVDDDGSEVVENDLVVRCDGKCNLKVRKDKGVMTDGVVMYYEVQDEMGQLMCQIQKSSVNISDKQVII